MFHSCLNNIKCFIFAILFCGAMSGDAIKQNEYNIFFYYYCSLYLNTDTF